MSSGPPFERYPGPPPGSGEVYRVISPTRDVLAWVSVAGRLSLARFLIREGDEWRTVVEAASGTDAGVGTSWTLVYRDPVEVVLKAVLPTGETVRVAITVSRDGCEARIRPGLAASDLDSLAEVGEWFRLHSD